ncbi:MAG: metallophosphoesterase, partial [Promethearchaeota archaeon]
MSENIILEEIITNPYIVSDLEFPDIAQILHRTINILEEENLLLDLNIENSSREVLVIGDIHGNLKTLLKILEIIERREPRIIIFLGDIVDRGPYQLECLLLVLALKIRYPNKYFILKGNHETLEMNQYYGFYKIFVAKFNDQKKFDEILNLYNSLPFCALVNKSILCIHGGIPEDFEILRKLEGLKQKDITIVFKSIAKSLIQMIWNDPKSELKG